MTAKLTSTMLVIAGIIHVLPLTGVLGSGRLASLYGLDFSESNLAILMRHRAVLLGLVGVLLIHAAFKPGQQPVAFLVGFVSVISFLWLAWSTGGYNPQLAKVVFADVVALSCLVIGAVAYFVPRAGP